jgi:hypoxanthine phosphoribosyltransferase
MKLTVGSQTMTMQTLFSAEQISARVRELGAEIQNSFAENTHLIVLIVLNGGLIFGADLVRSINLKTDIQTVRLQSYHGTKSTGEIQLVGAAPIGLKGKHVLIVEDILESGRSLDYLLKLVKEQECQSVKIACLLDKPMCHEFSVTADFVGFSIGKNFVIGYGLDLDGAYRNLPFIAELV